MNHSDCPKNCENNLRANAQNTLQHFQGASVPPLPMPAGAHATSIAELTNDNLFFFRVLCKKYHVY